MNGWINGQIDNKWIDGGQMDKQIRQLMDEWLDKSTNR